MMPLPECRFRHTTDAEGRWRCSCRNLPIPRSIVTAADCRVCPVTHQLILGDEPNALDVDGRRFDGRWTHQIPDAAAPVISHMDVQSLRKAPRHLIYHLYPQKGLVWRDNIEELQRRIDQFTGRRLIYVALDDWTESRSVVRKALKPLDADVYWTDNIRFLGETPSLLSGLKKVLKRPGVTFYAHAKGVSHADSSVVFDIWARRMYTLLDRFDDVSQRLTRTGFCGLVRATGQPAADGPHEWHYPGSFYWFRNDVVGQRDFSRQQNHRYFSEQFPGHVVRFTESAALHEELLSGNPYRRDTWRWLEREVKLGGTVFPLTPPPRVAIVIAGRNNSFYLAEAIESALLQSIPCELVYADDSSIDDSIKVAQKFLPRGLRLLPSPVHKGVCDARNRGANATSAENIIFLDADDKLPPEYAAECLTSMSSETPFVYTTTRAFGDVNTIWGTVPWEVYDLWQHNQVNTSALWARWAFVAAGGWQDDVPTMWDYDLAIRCSRFGTPVPSPTAAVDYRIHAGSVSASLNERDGTVCVPFKEMIRRKNARLGIGCLISGRLPNLFPRWIDALGCSVRWAMSFGVLKHKPRLQLCLHGQAINHVDRIEAAASRYADTWESLEIRHVDLEIPHAPRRDQGDQLAVLLAQTSAEMQSRSGADIFWFVEDDILVPLRACAELFEQLTAGGSPPHGVSGVYRNRHLVDRCIGGWHREGRHEEPADFTPGVVQPVDFTGTGCLMFWTGRPETPQAWRTHTLDGQPAHDFCWGDDLRLAGGRLLMHGGVRCRHAVAEDEFLTC